MSGLVLPSITNCYFLRAVFHTNGTGKSGTFSLYQYNSKSYKYRISHIHKGNGMNEE